MCDKKLYLVCNAHLDPVWLWEWEEGLDATLSTFRIAAEFCENYEGFTFCHNESLLYEWVEEYEPELFEKIQRLVSEGKWNIIGGWYVQPDCNIPSGESFVRQILVGKNYFLNKFGIEPKTAVNFDPFGHSRGLVQILSKSGYHSYLFCRPDDKWLELPSNDFRWKGYDESEIITHRAEDHYNSEIGKAGIKLEKWLEKSSSKDIGMLLWGIGNHGGGPSKEDLEAIKVIIDRSEDRDILHSKPELYFYYQKEAKWSLPTFSKSMNPWAIGCYTSMAKVKQKHRQLENLYFQAEKILSIAALSGYMDYPAEKLDQALKDMLYCEFHDILPGSSIIEVEEYALQRLSHGLEIIDRLRAKAMFALISGEKPAEDGEFPIFVYNHNPYDIEETIVCEFQPLEPNFNSDVFWLPELFDSEGNSIEVQLEKESCNIINDHRKRIAFRANLSASSLNRFSCYLREIPNRYDIRTVKQPMNLQFENEERIIEIDRKTGLICKYQVDGYDYIDTQSASCLIMDDYADPWGMKLKAFDELVGEFESMNKEESAVFSGINQEEVDPIWVIEDGPVRTIVEAFFKYRSSELNLKYRIPRNGTEVEIEAMVYWKEKDKMLKMSFPTTLSKANCCGQVAYGREEYDRPGEELLAQKWAALYDDKRAFTIINDSTYGFDYNDGEMRLSMLRSPAYAGHPVEGNVEIVRNDRFEPRIDQGMRTFRFWINAGQAEERLNNIDREALVKNEKPVVLYANPSGNGLKSSYGIKLSNDSILLSAMKISEDSESLVVRLFNPLDDNQISKIDISVLDAVSDLSFAPFEIKSLSINIDTKEMKEVDLLERECD